MVTNCDEKSGELKNRVREEWHELLGHFDFLGTTSSNLEKSFDDWWSIDDVELEIG